MMHIHVGKSDFFSLFFLIFGLNFLFPFSLNDKLFYFAKGVADILRYIDGIEVLASSASGVVGGDDPFQVYIFLKDLSYGY